MIYLTKLNGIRFTLNSDLIETITENPDTTVRLINDTIYIVKESMDDIISKVTNYKRSIYNEKTYIKQENVQ